MTKKRILIFCAVLALVLAGLILTKAWNDGGSRFSRRAEADVYALELTKLNTTLAEPYALQAGDTIDVSFVCTSGELVLSIGQENWEPVYEGRNPDLSTFRVTIPEDGTYLLSVSGTRAVGSVSFRINRSAD